MAVSKIYKKIFAAFILLFLISNRAYSYDDGFASARRIDSRHFTVYYAPKLDAGTLAQQLNITLADKILAGGGTAGTDASELGLRDMLDTFFSRVCDILDMQLYSFKGTIKVCQDYAQLNQVYQNLFDNGLEGKLSFYVYPLNTIYISADSFKREVLGHEIAHAIISHYFVVQTPMKIQEILAGYVEYQLRKSK